MTLEVGKTHDVIVLVNDTQELGLTVKPHTYRLGRAPEFIPRIGGGEPGAQDFDHWRAFTQRDFHLGEGPSSFDRIQGLETIARGYGVVAWPSGLGPALLPRATSMEGLVAMELSSDDEVRIVEMSNAPRALYKRLLLTHTGAVGNELWVRSHTQLASDVKSVVMHSNVMFTAYADTGYQAYGSQPSPNAATYYAPAYSTDADLLWNYDGKLWKGDDNKIAYLTPTTGWAAALEVGAADHKILNTAVAFGRIYFGKEDALWCYEGGRVYEVEPFHGEVSSDNFKLMHATHGALYFNVKNKLYRYTGAGNIELLMVYPYEALLGPATTAQDKLYFSVRDQSFSGSVYVYDFKSRGLWREWDLYSEAARNTVHDVVHVTGLEVAANKLWIAPVESTSGISLRDPLFMPTAFDSGLVVSVSIGRTGDGYTRFAQRLTATRSGNLLGLRFRLVKVFDPPFDLEFAVYADDGGSPGAPTGGALVSVTIPSTDIPRSYGWVTGIFTSPLAITSGTAYHLVVQTAADATDANEYYLTSRQDAGGDTGLHRYDGSWGLYSDYFLGGTSVIALPAGMIFGTRMAELPSRRVEGPPTEYAHLHTGYVRMYTPWMELGYPGLTKFVNAVSVETLLEGPAAQVDVAIAVDGGEEVTLRSCQEEYTSGNFQDFTANLIDSDDTTYMDFEWGTWGSHEAVLKNVGQYLYICGSAPFDTIAWRMRTEVYHSREFTTPDADLTFEVWTGVEWRRVLTAEDSTRVGSWVFARSGQLSWRPPRHWEERTFQNITGYWLRIGVANAPNTSRQNNQRCYEVSLLARSSETQRYTNIGSITEVGDALTEFTLEQRVSRIAFRFGFVGAREAVSYLKSFKISYNPVGAGKQEVRFIAVARDNLKRLDGIIEHSGAYVSEAVQSMGDAGLLYVVGLPYPNVHSRNMQVQMGESIIVPVLAYTAQTGKPRLVPYADVPVRLIEG
jgi:hypothetical protein